MSVESGIFIDNVMLTKLKNSMCLPFCPYSSPGSSTANIPLIPRSPWGVYIKLPSHPWVYLLCFTVSIIYLYWTRILWVTHALCWAQWTYCSGRTDRVSFDRKAAIVLVSIEFCFWSVVWSCETWSWYHHCKRHEFFYFCLFQLRFYSSFPLYGLSIYYRTP